MWPSGWISKSSLEIAVVLSRSSGLPISLTATSQECLERWIFQFYLFGIYVWGHHPIPRAGKAEPSTYERIVIMDLSLGA